jgi:integrin beta 8
VVVEATEETVVVSDVGAQGPAGPTGPTGPQGPQGEPGTPGTPGTDGKSVLNGAGAPSNGLGVDGDFYIDTVAENIYGPKAAGVWGSPTSLIGPQGPTGATGPQGPQGDPGAPGVDGKSVLNGSGAPSGGLGVDGDFYIDTTAEAIYGPKTAGVWGPSTSLIGPQGPPGAGGDDLVSFTQFGGLY